MPIPLSGKYGQLVYNEEFILIYNWLLTHGVDPVVIYSAETQNLPERLAKWRNGTLTFSGVGATLPKNLFIENHRTIELYNGPSNQVFGFTGPGYNLTATFRSFTATWEFIAGGSLNYAAEFNISKYIPVYSSSRQFMQPEFECCPTPICELEIQAADTKIQDVERASFTISNRNVNLPNTEFLQAGEELLGPVDVTALITIQNVSHIFLDQLNAVTNLKFYTTATEYWEFKYMMLSNIRDIIVNVQTGEIQKATLEFGFTFEDNQLSKIAHPVDGVLWPKRILAPVWL